MRWQAVVWCGGRGVGGGEGRGGGGGGCKEQHAAGEAVYACVVGLTRGVTQGMGTPVKSGKASRRQASGAGSARYAPARACYPYPPTHTHPHAADVHLAVPHLPALRTRLHGAAHMLVRTQHCFCLWSQAAPLAVLTNRQAQQAGQEVQAAWQRAAATRASSTLRAPQPAPGPHLKALLHGCTAGQAVLAGPCCLHPIPAFCGRALWRGSAAARRPGAAARGGGPRLLCCLHERPLERVAHLLALEGAVLLFALRAGEQASGWAGGRAAMGAEKHARTPAAAAQHGLHAAMGQRSQQAGPLHRAGHQACAPSSPPILTLDRPVPSESSDPPSARRLAWSPDSRGWPSPTDIST